MKCHVLEGPNLFADFLTKLHYDGSQFQNEYELILENYGFMLCNTSSTL